MRNELVSGMLGPVPSPSMPPRIVNGDLLLQQANILITNFHAFIPRETPMTFAVATS